MRTRHELREASKAALRQRTGMIKTEDKLVSFLYDLMRDHLPCGVVEDLVLNQVTTADDSEFLFTNGFLANYAKDLAQRLRGTQDEPGTAREGRG